MGVRRRRAVGAELTEDGGVDFRVWAPDRKRVSIVIDGADVPLESEDHGYFRGVIGNARAGSLYRFRLDGESETYPDPASRYQPDGPHGASCVIDPAAYEWRDGSWRGPDIDRLVVYEMHIGTYTREGTYRAAAALLPQLRDVGVTMVEVMPLHDFAGRFGWGYDGVDLWAPTRLYGAPDDVRAFVDAAHAQGIAVILDVVYNHFGPDGCYLTKFAKNYFTKHATEWGDAINFDGEDCEGVREFFSENAAYWIDEFHFDGLRLDATQSIFDSSPEHIVKVVAGRVREAAGNRKSFVVAENEPQDVALIEQYGVDAMWNDDWHHSAIVAATGRREAYYTDYTGRPQEFVSMAKSGFLYQGQWYSWQKKRRGTPSRSLRPRQLVCCLQNHDQIANSAHGERIHQITSPGKYRALTALLLLGPNTPMLFQGEEFAASAPFLYFADHQGDLADAVAKGRADFMTQFRSIAAMHDQLPRPNDPLTFERCKLDHSEDDARPRHSRLHRDLLRLRRDDDALRGPVEGAVIGSDAFVLRYGGDRLLVVNLGRDLRLDIVPEPLLAPPRDASWGVLWSSESPEYGGSGTAALVIEGVWNIPGQAAFFLTARVAAPVERSNADDRDR
jgi:maltooligosyltrehalose trehalohydrolase